MSRKSVFITTLSMMIVTVSFVAEASAQNRFGHRPLRWLGQGFGDGYHRCNPGYDSSHYNPYSAHNSFLYSQTPQYKAITGTQNYAMSATQDLRFRVGVPYSIYAAPPRNNPFGQVQGIQGMPGATIDNSFEPTKREEDSMKKRSADDDSSDDFEGDSIFDEDVDMLDDRGDQLLDPNEFNPAEKNDDLDDDRTLPNPNRIVPAEKNDAPDAGRIGDELERLEQRIPAAQKPSDIKADSNDDNEYELPPRNDSAFKLPVLNGTGLAPIKKASMRKMKPRK